jgi:cell division septation protein DedD
VVRAVIRLVLLVSLGFGVGLLFGLVTQEPELLVNHLQGESESVRIAGEIGSGNQTIASGQTDARDPQAERLALRDAAGESVTAAALPVVAAAAEGPTPSGASMTRPTSRSPKAPETTPARGGDDSGDAAPKALWSIQVGAFSDESAAARLVEGLDEKGYPVELIPATEVSERWRVRVQPVEGESAARALADRLKRKERLPTWVIPLEAGSGS